MPERIYMNRRPGEERIHVEISAAELPDILNDLAHLPDDVSAATLVLHGILASSRLTFARIATKEN